MMRRTTALLMTATLAVASLTACGGDSEPASAEPGATDPPAEEPADDEPTDEEPAATDPPAEEPADDEPDATDPPAEEPADDEPADDDGPSGPAIDSIDDVPPQCRALMADYLQNLEPIVSSIDWSTATLNDFDAVSTEFEALSTEFDTGSIEAGCDDLNFAEDDDGLELVIEFAGDVAPGTVPFFEFLIGFLGPTDDGGEVASGGIETCDDAIAAIQSFMDEYDSLDDVPVSDMMVLAEMGTAMMTCTPDQLAFFDSAAVTEFLGG